jgi:dihydroflavonol-4-reductase
MVERVAVTGAAGFLGAHIVAGLVERGVGVVSLVREPAQLGARAQEATAQTTTLEHAIRDPTIVAGCDAIVHAAAVRHRYGVDASEYRRSNVDLVESIMRAAAGRVGRFVLVSSVGVYGYPANLPITETYAYAPVTEYASTKVEAERLARRVARELGLPLVIARPTIIYGSGDRNGMLDKLVRMLRSGTYRIVGNGDNVLHHTHVDDVVRGVLLTTFHPAAVDEDFILAGPETTTLGRLSEQVATGLGKHLPRIHVPLAIARGVATIVDRAASSGLAFRRQEPPINHEKLDVMTRSVAFDPSKATRMLGYKPTVGYEEGLRRTLPATP